MARSENVQPAFLYSVKVVLFAGDEAPNTREMEQIILGGFLARDGRPDRMPAQVIVRAAPFNPDREEDSDV